jgi:uncharacterized membrane protein YhhN
MQRSVPPLLTGAMIASGSTALWGLDQEVFWLAAIFKPLTTLLLFLVLGRVDTPLRRKLRWGLVFSLIGDVALLGKGAFWFPLGLAAFLVTHLCYIAAFFPVTVRSWRVGVTAVLGAAGAGVTLVLAYPGAALAGVGVAVGVYSFVLTGMLVTVSGTVGGPLRRAPLAALGALLFYIADVSIAFNVFVPSISLPHPVLFTTGLYWIGQYNIMKAARAGVRDSTA